MHTVTVSQGPQQPRLAQWPLRFPEVPLTTPSNLRPERKCTLSAPYTYPGVTADSWQGLTGTRLPCPPLPWHVLRLLGTAL